MYQKLSERIRSERIRLGLLVKELGNKVSLSESTQSKIEKGTRNPTIEYLLKASVLGMDVNYILTGKRVLELRGDIIKSTNGCAFYAEEISDLKAGFAERLRLERKKVRLTQIKLCKICGVSKQTQSNYEKGLHVPDTNYLMTLLTLGFDVNYVLTGNRTLSHPAVQPLVNAFFDADLALQTTICNLLGLNGTTIQKSAKKAVKVPAKPEKPVLKSPE